MKSFFLSISLVALFSINAICQIDYTDVAFQDTSTDYIKSNSTLKSAPKVLKNKVRAFPNRLDYRYEYLNELSLAAEWNKFTIEVINLIEYSYKADHQWLWNPEFDAIGEDPEGFLLNTIEDYVFMLYVAGEPAQFDHLRSICDLVLEYKPKHIDFMTYPAMTYDELGDYEAAFSYLQEAEVAHPNNAMVSLLIAENYEKRGMVNAAMAYYQKAARYGELEDVKEAQNHIYRLSFK